MKDIKQIIVMRKDLNMRKGKMIAQGSHASMKFILDMASKQETGFTFNYPDVDVQAWMQGNFKKITVSVNSEQELLDIYNQAKANGLIVSLITDNGLTEFNGVPTNTCIAIGPCDAEKVNPLTSHLKLL